MNERSTSEFVVGSIGWVRGGRTTMDDSDHWGQVVSEIAVDPERFGPDGLVGLAGFSHVEVVFVFDRTTERSD